MEPNRTLGIIAAEDYLLKCEIRRIRRQVRIYSIILGLVLGGLALSIFGAMQ